MVNAIFMFVVVAIMLCLDHRATAANKKRTITFITSSARGYVINLSIRFCNYDGDCSRHVFSDRLSTSTSKAYFLDIAYIPIDSVTFQSIPGETQDWSANKFTIKDEKNKVIRETCFVPLKCDLTKIADVLDKPFSLRVCASLEGGTTPTWYYKTSKRDAKCVVCVCKDNAKCHSTNGRCPGGECPGGFSGKDCNIPCTQGTYGPSCAYNCSVGCASVCGTVHGACSCSPGYTGSTCDRVCETGTYGPGCIHPCGHCTSGECERVSGDCEPPDCSPGYIGNKCDTPCPSKKFGKNCTEECNCFAHNTCNGTTGDCGDAGCLSNWITRQCNQYDGCPANHYGKECVECGGCRRKCDDPDPSQPCTGQCTDEGTCPHGCSGGYTGELCDTCVESNYGHLCRHNCGHCIEADACHPITGICLRTGCQDGYLGHDCRYECADGRWGKDCARECSIHCKDEAPCQVTTGHCAPCEFGWEGPRCDIEQYCNKTGYHGGTCGDKCHHCLDDTRCSQFGAVCEYGCALGYYGSTCEKPCLPGHYGPACESLCGYCDKWVPCDVRTGKCPFGCLGHHTPPFCTECEEGYVGVECERTCGHCIHNEPCEPEAGTCVHGCLDGFTGKYCDRRKTALQYLDMDTIFEEDRQHLLDLKRRREVLGDEG